MLSGESASKCANGFQIDPKNYAALLSAIVCMGFVGQPAAVHAGLAGLERVATGLSSPMFTTHAPGDHTRLFIAERGTPVGDDPANSTANIRILNLTTGTLEATPFLSITGVNVNGEGGLLGLAFHPDYQMNGKFYVNVTASDMVPDTPFSTYIREYTRSSTNPNLADPTPGKILEFTQPQVNHNGGWIGFSPNDGYLYIMTGDGGLGNDTGTGHTPGTGNAQDITANFLGKTLRVDVNRDDFADANKNYGIPFDIVEGDVITTPGNPFAPNAPGEMDPTGDDEIWAYGLRNPFRASFDRATGDLWIGDVGQSTREEIDFQPASSPGGENYGWRLREGTIQNPASGIGGPKPPGNVDPVYDYPRTGTFGGTVVTGGHIYRGPDPTLQGKYFFADSLNTFSASDDRYWMFDPANPYGTVADIKPSLATDPGVSMPGFPVAFGEDAIGNLYITYLSGTVFRIRTNAVTPGDFDGDGDIDGVDGAAWQSGFGTTGGASRAMGDADGDGDVDGADFLAWQRNVGWSPLNVGTPPRSAATPEPASLTMLAVALAAAAMRRKLAGGPCPPGSGPHSGPATV